VPLGDRDEQVPAERAKLIAKAAAEIATDWV
jgi:hypothetical protein